MFQRERRGIKEKKEGGGGGTDSKATNIPTPCIGQEHITCRSNSPSNKRESRRKEKKMKKKKLKMDLGDGVFWSQVIDPMSRDTYRILQKRVRYELPNGVPCGWVPEHILLWKGFC